MVLTDEGRILCDQCTKTLAELDNTLTDLSERRGELRGVLRMTAPDAYGRSQLMPILTRFLSTWPKLEADVNFSDRTVDIIADGYDLAIRIGGRGLSDDVVTRVIARHRQSVFASPEYLATHGEPITVEQLAQHACLRFAQGGRPSPMRFRGKDGDAVNLDLRGRVRFDSADALRDAAVAGLGIIQLPDFVVEHDLTSGRLKRILEPYEPPLIPIIAIYPTKEFLSHKVRFFIDALVSGLR